MTKNFFLANFMSLIAIRLSFPIRIVSVLFLLASSDGLAQSCNCPPAATCNPCNGGFTKLTLKYNGSFQTYVKAEDQGGIVYGWAIVNPGETFTFQGSIANEKFQGSSVYVYIDFIFPILSGMFGTGCGSELPGSTSGLFEVVSLVSKNGGPVCCAPGTTDSTPPNILGCPSNKTATLPASSCLVPVNWIEPTYNDNCMSTWTKSHLPGALFPVGQTTVTYVARDTYGNQSAPCSFTVTVNDFTAPIFTTCPGNITRVADASCQAKGGWILPTALDNNSCIPVITSTHDPDDIFPIGPPTLVTYTATDTKGNTAICSFNVVVQDTTPPAFTNCPTVIEITASNSCPTVDLPTPTLTDNCSANPTYTSSHPNNSEFPIGETLVTYTALDGAANAASCSFLVVVSNPTPPEVEGCLGTITKNVNANEKDSVAVTWNEPSASVICGELSEVTKTHEPGSNFPLGTTKVTYTFKDEAGKVSDCTFDVVVLEANAPFGISNVVTPDGDGINDVWTLANIESFKNNTVVVIDRWGNRIFHANGYDNERTVWKGTNENGTMVPTGTYFYTIEVRDQGKVVLKKGFLEVIQ